MPNFYRNGLTVIMENLMSPSNPTPRGPKKVRMMNPIKREKSKILLWLCFTLVVLAGIKYLPAYMVEQRKLDMEERMLDMREEAFLRQRVAPTVSVPVPGGVHVNSSQLL